MTMIEVLLMLVLLLAARLLTPKMLETQSAGVRFGIGLGLFGIYTVVSVLMFRNFCTFDGREIAVLTGSEVWSRMVCSFLVVNLSVALAACIFFFTRDRRKLSQEEKMKLKDL